MTDIAFATLYREARSVIQLEVGDEALAQAALAYAHARGWIEPARANAIAAACNDMGAELGIPPEVRTWRRIRDELATLRQALHIEGEQTATEAARGLEDVAAHVLEQHEVTDVGVWCEPCGGEVARCPHEDGWLVCSACGQGSTTFDTVAHTSDCLLALAWHALGKPHAVGDL